MYPKAYLDIIYEICQKYNISIKQINLTSILELNYNKSTHFIWSRRFDLNSAISAKIADNKHDTIKVLESHNIPVVSCKKITRPYTIEYADSMSSNYCICKELLDKHGAVVIKPNNSYEGNGVYKCINGKQIEEALTNLYAKYKYLIVSPYKNIKSEYRTIFLKGEVLLVYKKELPYIVSDGKKPLIELLLQKEEYFSFISSFKEKELKQVYEKGEKIYLNWKFNLSQGALCSIVYEKSLYNKLSSLAIAASNAIGIAFASVDIIIDENDQMRILEINSGVAMDQFIQKETSGRQIAASIYEKAIKYMFDF